MAYRFQATGVSRSPNWHQVAGVGLASPELWLRNHPQPEDPVRDLKNDREDIRRRQATSLRAATSSNELPDELIRLYPDLDNDSRNFLKRGPRSTTERLAYAQQVHLLAHLDAQLAPQSAQRDFQESGAIDSWRHFVGPDGRVYVRNEDSKERPGAKIRRGYENLIGGFTTPEIDDSLAQIPEATRSKRADVELYSPPILPEQEERERLLAEHNINPAAWQSGIRADEEVQKTFQELGYLWDAIYPWSYVGPDGAVYFKTELTQPEPFSQRRRVRDWEETQEYLRSLPEPTADELMFRAMAMNGMFPGGRQVRFTNSSGRFVPPNGMDARAAIRARLADIPRQAALHGWKQPPDPADNPQAPHPIANPLAPQPTVNPRISKKRFWRKFSWGRRGNPKTKDDLERDFAARIRGDHWEQTRGSRNENRQELREEYLPNLFGGREGSTYPDITFKARRNPFPDQEEFYQRVEQGDVDTKTLRATLADHDKTLRNFLKYRGNWLLGVKHHQLEEAIRRKKEEERDDEYFWPEE